MPHEVAGASAIKPKQLPLYEENPPIPSSLPLEDGATLRVYQFKEYLSPDVLQSFEEAHRDHGITVEATSFDSMDEALATITAPGAAYDVFFPSLDSLGPLVQSRRLRPLNHSYLSNTGNLWPMFRGDSSPAFDPGMRYATPYTVYTTGIAWRDDLVRASDRPGELDDPYGALWNPAYEGKVGIYDSPREALAMAMLRQGVSHMELARQADLDAAVESLLALDSAVGLKLEGEGTYEGLTEGDDAVRQAWSGDAISARRYMLDEGGEEAATADQIRFAWNPGGIVGVDLTAILSQGKHPVAAHAFLDHLMDDQIAMRNFAWNGYQPATKSAVPSQFRPGGRWADITGPHLANSIVSPEQWAGGILLTALTPDAQARWMRAWDTVRASAVVA